MELNDEIFRFTNDEIEYLVDILIAKKDEAVLHGKDTEMIDNLLVHLESALY